MTVKTMEPAFKFDLRVQEEGIVELALPFPVGTLVEVFVVQAKDHFEDLLLASESSLDFWNNSLDDEDWNDA